MTTIGITGASGYVGSLLAAAAARDHEVVALGRRSVDGFQCRTYDLAVSRYSELLDGLEAIVHCAYDLSLTRRVDIDRVNVAGTMHLADAAAAAGVRFVLISSMSAYPGTRQIYGGAKLRSEARVLETGGEVVRLGLVYSEDGEGMIGALRRLVSLPLTPVIARRAKQFTVHADDMVRGVLALVAHAEPVGEPIGLAHPEPVTFEDLLLRLAAMTETRPRFLPVPWAPVYAAMRLAEAGRVPLPLRADSVLGLVRPAASVPRSELWRQLGVRLRPFSDWDSGIPGTDHRTLRRGSDAEFRSP